MAGENSSEQRNDVPDSELADTPQMGERIESQRITRLAIAGRYLGPVLALIVYFVLPGGEAGLSSAGKATAAVGVLMAIWWVTEALPLPATSLLPLALFPITGVLSMEDAAAPYANDLIFLFMGGFMLALAMQRWGLHRRIALLTVRAVGTTPTRMIGGFMVASAFLSMWVSNTATTVMMLPIGLAVLKLVYERVEGQSSDEDSLTGSGAPAFSTALMLGIAYAASIGSLGTIIGTPPNTFLIAYLQEDHGIDIGFGQWMLFATPMAVVFLGLAWLMLTRVLYPPAMDEIPGGRELIDEELGKMGPMSRGEKVVLGVFVTTALLWISRSLFLQDLFAGTTLEGIDDAAIAIGAAIVLFAWPIDRKHGVFALDWDTAKQLPWGILLLFGGGLALAAGVGENGVDKFIGQQVEALGGIPVYLLIASTVLIVIVLTELTSNTATTAAVVPILGGVAVGLGYGPMMLVVPAALAATCAFMLPVATPPNAIVFGSGYITIKQMVYAGVLFNVVGLALITGIVLLLAGPVLGVSFTQGQ